jgi:hypothetical protein
MSPSMLGTMGKITRVLSTWPVRISDMRLLVKLRLTGLVDAAGAALFLDQLASLAARRSKDRGVGTGY